MSLLNLFKKPNWKNKDDSIRANAVAHESAQELINQLDNIAENDSSENVRSAAIKRLKDYEVITHIALSDKSKQVKNTAYKKLQDWFAKKQDDAQLKLIKTITESKTLEVAALHSKNKEIRSYCIDNIAKQGLLADLLLQEKDRNLRQIILTKIDKPSTLKLLLKRVKNKDKTILKAIQAKLENDGDMSKIKAKKALELCEQMEKLIHNASSSSKQDVDILHGKWTDLNSDSSDSALESYQQRYQGAYRTASLTFDPKQREEFLNQQRQQRITSKITELNISIEESKESTWEQIQSQISKYSGFDLSHANTNQKEEFSQAVTELKALRDTKTKEQELPEKLLTVADKLDAALKHKYNQPDQITHFRKMWEENAKRAKNNSAFSTLKNRFDTAMLKLAERIEKSAVLRDEAAKNAIAAIGNVRTLIKDGQLADAKSAINKIADNKKIAAQHPLIKQHKFEFDTLWNDLKELRQWQTWSNDKIRIRLVEELKKLVGTGTHPDALLKKMKESNKQWKDMEDHEKLEGDRFGVRNQELYTQFREVQQSLFEPAQKFFEKRSEIWGKELEEVQTHIQALHDVDLIETSDRDLARMVRDAVKQLRNLDSIPPKARGKVAAQIRSGTARIDSHLQESYKVAELRKQNLIEQAQELIVLEDLNSAIEQAKALQSEWKNAGIVHQTQERKLWRSFRKANDAVFNRIKEQRDTLKAENKELLDQAQKLIVNCETDIKSALSAQNIHSFIERFKDDFNALNIENKGIVNKANTLIESCKDKVTKLANSELISELKKAECFAKLCQQSELEHLNNEEVQEQWQQLTPLNDNKLAKQLKKRLNNSSKENLNYVKSAGTILIATEYLTGQATPDAFKEQRLEYQVEELAKRMGGEQSLSETDKAIELLSSWFILQGAKPEFIETNEKRITKAMTSLYEILKGK